MMNDKDDNKTTIEVPIKPVVLKPGDLYVPLDDRLHRIEAKQSWLIIAVVVVFIAQITDNGKLIYDFVTALGAAIK